MPLKTKLALLAGLSVAGCIAPAFAASPTTGLGNLPLSPDLLQAHASWRDAITHIDTPKEGCFTASYPSILWKQVACKQVTPRVAPIPPHFNTGVSRLSVGSAQTTGNGNDYAIETASLITQTVGNFPSVSGVTSESGVGVAAFGGGGILGPNEYTLQINSNFDSTTAACKNHSGCTVWQQFIYSPDYSVNGQAAVFMQYWLIGYGGHSCPSGWGSDGAGDCYKNSSAATAPDIPITQLANLKLTGKVVSGGNDTVTFANGSTAYSITGKDSVLYLSQVWDQSEFNIVGNAGGSEAKFNSGSSVTVKVAVNDGSTATPTCASGAGTTGETNNLTLGSCTASGGSTPSIQFTESN